MRARESLKSSPRLPSGMLLSEPRLSRLSAVHTMCWRSHISDPCFSRSRGSSSVNISAGQTIDRVINVTDARHVTSGAWRETCGSRRSGRSVWIIRERVSMAGRTCEGAFLVSGSASNDIVRASSVSRSARSCCHRDWQEQTDEPLHGTGRTAVWL